MYITRIDNYLKDQINNLALLINGYWGCGKTYFIQNNLLNHLIDIDYKPIYVSLFDIHSLDELSKKIFLELTLSSNKKMPKSLTITNLKNIANLGTNVLFDIVTKKSGIDLSKSFKNGLNNLVKSKFPDKIVFIFDDLERCNLELKEILGYINTLIEHNNFNIIIICNELKITDKPVYQNYKEKLIQDTIEFTPDLDTVFKNILNSLNRKVQKYDKSYFNIEYILSLFSKHNYFNIRTFKYIISKLLFLESYLSPYQNNFSFLTFLSESLIDECFYHVLNKNIQNTSRALYPMTFFLIDSVISNCEISKEKIAGSHNEYSSWKLENDMTRHCNSLKHWYMLEENDLIIDMNYIKSNIHDLPINQYVNILSTFVELSVRGIIDERDLNSFFELLIENISKNDDKIENVSLEIQAQLSAIENKEVKNKFIVYGKKLLNYEILQNSEQTMIETWLKNLGLEQNKNFLQNQIQKNKDQYKTPLFSNIEPEEFIKGLHSAKNEELFDLRMFLSSYYKIQIGIFDVYQGDYLEADLKFLKKLKKKLTTEEFSDKIKKHVIQLLINDISRYTQGYEQTKLATYANGEQ